MIDCGSTATATANANLADDIAKVLSEIQELKKRLDNPQGFQVSDSTISSNTISVYFDKLNYYHMLVSIMGVEKAHNYLLFRLGESKDVYGPLNLIFQNGGCPIEIDKGMILIHRTATDTERDPTGYLIDKENKIKIACAMITAFNNDTFSVTAKFCKEQRLKSLLNDDVQEPSFEQSQILDGLVNLKKVYDDIDKINKLKLRSIAQLQKLCPVITVK